MSPYFDPAYFDPAYFDAGSAPVYPACVLIEDGGSLALTLDGGGPTDYLLEDGCVASSGGGRRYRYPIPIIDDEPAPDDAFLIALTL